MYAFLLTTLFAQATLPATPVETLSATQYAGVWVQPQASIPRLVITEENGQLIAEAFSPCGGAVCPLGATLLEAEGSQQWLKGEFENAGGSYIVSLLPGSETQLYAEITYVSPSGITEAAATKFVYTRSSESSEATYAPSDLDRGMIYGKVFGLARSTASLFHVSLYGPDDPNLFVSSQSLGREKAYRFDQLPQGHYWLFVESKGPTVIRAYPAMSEIEVMGGEGKVMDVELR